MYINEPLKWLQLRRHDTVKASYDNLKMRMSFGRIPSN